MISLLKIIKPETPFTFQMQGYYNEHRPGAPIADNNKLLPFISFAVDPVQYGIVSAWVMCMDGSHVYDLGFLPYIVKNGKWSYYHDGSDTGANLKMGYYYIQAELETAPKWAIDTFMDYVERVEHGGGVVEAQDCLSDSLVKYSGGLTTVELFKSEVFKVPQPGTLPVGKGAFSSGFSTAFDV